MVFVDESGHFSNTDSISLAGFVSDDESWNSFCIEWKSLLLKHGLPAIHMKEIMSSKGKSPAANWEMPRKLSMLSEFIFVIRKYVQAGFGIGMDAVHYRSVVAEITEAAKTMGVRAKPFEAKRFCVARFVRTLMQYYDEVELQQGGMPEPINLTFDDDEAYAMQCYSLICKIKARDAAAKSRIVSVGFADDNWFYPLQAADILAYATCNELNKSPDMRWKETNIFTDLLKADNPTYGIVNKSELWDSSSDQIALEALVKEMVVN